MLDSYIYLGLRTPFGRRGGALASLRPDDLLAGAIAALVQRCARAAERVDDVMVGCANQAGEDSRCVARHAALLAGLSERVPGTVLQRNCGSGLGAVVSASHAITAGEAEVIIAGGVESMSRAPFVVGKAEQAFSPRFEVHDSAVGSRFPNPRISAQYGNDSMPATADNLAVEYGLSRAQADAFALRSQQRYAAARAAGFFDAEILPVILPATRKRAERTVGEDEPPRPDTDLDKLGRLKALNAGGVSTAGNAAGINDGAVALLMGSRGAGEALGLAPLGRVLSSAVAGVAPRVMGIGPVPAAHKALERAGLGLEQMDVIEINEAFAAQVLACAAALGLAFDDARLNPNGGAIAVGHPLGASGGRLVLTALRELKRRGGRYALVALCVGVGQGIAAVLEAL